jgi:hypothetical protein
VGVGVRHRCLSESTSCMKRTRGRKRHRLVSESTSYETRMRVWIYIVSNKDTGASALHHMERGYDWCTLYETRRVRVDVGVKLDASARTVSYIRTEYS